MGEHFASKYAQPIPTNRPLHITSSHVNQQEVVELLRSDVHDLRRSYKHFTTQVTQDCPLSFATHEISRKRHACGGRVCVRGKRVRPEGAVSVVVAACGG